MLEIELSARAPKQGKDMPFAQRAILGWEATTVIRSFRTRQRLLGCTVTGLSFPPCGISPRDDMLRCAE